MGFYGMYPLVMANIAVWEFDSHRLEPTKIFFFSKKYHFGYHQNHLKIFACLDSCFCVFMWIFIEIFTKKSRLPGSSDMEKNLQSCYGPFRELAHGQNCVKLGENPEFVAKELGFPVFSQLFSMCLHFFVFFSSFSRLFFMFAFDFCPLFFLRFWTKLEKSQKRKKPRVFFVFLSFFYRFLSFFLSFFYRFFIVFLIVFFIVFYCFYFRPENAFSNYFRIIFDSQNQFSSNFRLIFDLKTDFTAI